MRRQELGAEVRRRREGLGWSREEFAMRVPMSTAGLTDIENGVTKNPQRRTLDGMAKALNCTVEALTGERPPPVAQPDGRSEVELLEAYRALNYADRSTLLRVARGLLREQPEDLPQH